MNEMIDDIIATYKFTRNIRLPQPPSGMTPTSRRLPPLPSEFFGDIEDDEDDVGQI